MGPVGQIGRRWPEGRLESKGAAFGESETAWVVT